MKFYPGFGAGTLAGEKDGLAIVQRASEDAVRLYAPPEKLLDAPDAATCRDFLTALGGQHQTARGNWHRVLLRFQADAADGTLLDLASGLAYLLAREDHLTGKSTRLLNTLLRIASSCLVASGVAITTSDAHRQIRLGCRQTAKSATA